MMKKAKLKILTFGAIVLALKFFGCSKDDDKAVVPLTLGDFHAGGIIFYLDNTGQHGLVCAVKDQGTNLEWCDVADETAGAKGEAIGTGMQNTEDIVTSCPVDGSAADVCLSLTLNGFSDWFLPAIDELNEIYLNKEAINATATANGGTALADDVYWSSTELDAGGHSSSWTQDMESGTPGTLTKFGTAYVRAIRAF